MIGRIVWFAALAIIAGLTSIVQLDRQSRVTPGLAILVPEPFRAFAQARIAARAIQSSNGEQAVAEARKLVERRPIPAEHLRILAAAQFKAERNEEAALSVQVAAKRGWRDVLAQETVLRLAVAADDPAEAARRYTALLLSKSSRDEMLIELGPVVFGESGSVGRQTLAEIVAGSDRLPSSLLRRGPRVMPGDAFAEVVKLSMERGAEIECPALTSAIAVLRNRDAPAADKLERDVASGC